MDAVQPPVAGPTVRTAMEQLRRMESSNLTVSLYAGVEHLAWLASLTDEQKAEMAEYDRQANEWNAHVRRLRAAREDELQARRNAAATAAVRKAACPRCYATHAGEC